MSGWPNDNISENARNPPSADRSSRWRGGRDVGLLQSALDRPFAGFGESEFYKTPAEKAGAILESIVKNPPFVAGNKRTGYVLMRLLLMRFGEDLRATQDEKYDFVIGVAAGQLAFPEIVTWIKEKLARKELS